jgi:NTE family protein
LDWRANALFTLSFVLRAHDADVNMQHPGEFGLRTPTVKAWVLLLGGPGMRRATAAFAAAFLAACGTSFNEPINVPVRPNAARTIPVGLPEVGGDTVVALAFSGGGTRAAAFAHGVLRALDLIPAEGGGTYFDKIVFISGVSGGSIAAAYYGLRGRSALLDFRERFLMKDAEEDLVTEINLISLARGFEGGINEASKLPRWLDRNLFDGATLGDLYQKGKPIVWINASDLYNRTPFLFSPLTFTALCSDAHSYPLSQAVAASAAVPIAFVPIVLATFPDGCDAPLPRWVEHALANHNAGAQVRAFALALRRYRDPGQLRFVKLADGGLTDNFGLSGMVVARAAAEQPYAPLSRQKAVHLRRIIFIIVNAGLASGGNWARTVQGPTGIEMVNAVTDTAINSAVRSGYDAFRLTVREWEEATRKWRCRLPQEELLRLGVSTDWRCSAVSFDVVELALDQLDPVRASLLSAVPTRLKLPVEDVDLVIDAGTDAVLRHPALRLGRASRGPN